MRLYVQWNCSLHEVLPLNLIAQTVTVECTLDAFSLTCFEIYEYLCITFHWKFVPYENESWIFIREQMLKLYFYQLNFWISTAQMCIDTNERTYIIFNLFFQLSAYANCANDPFCAASAVQGYMTRYATIMMTSIK